jgi:hypothetical protein
MRTFAFVSAALLAVCLSACSNAEPPLVREITGTVVAPAGQTIEHVLVEDPLTGNGAGSGVDESGQFTVRVWGGADYGRVRVLFTVNDYDTVGIMRFPDGQGGFTTLLPITAAPDPSAIPQNAPGGGGDSGPAYVEVKVAIDLGQIEDIDGDRQYEPSLNPLAQVDLDKDGRADLDDSDDDDDGIADAKDADDDNDGVEDKYESGDDNQNGMPDELDKLGQDDSSGP